MSRKKMIETLKACGRNRIRGKELDDCYTVELKDVLHKEMDTILSSLDLIITDLSPERKMLIDKRAIPFRFWG